jgi:hypothetical protein
MLEEHIPGGQKNEAVLFGEIEGGPWVCWRAQAIWNQRDEV